MIEKLHELGSTSGYACAAAFGTAPRRDEGK